MTNQIKATRESHYLKAVVAFSLVPVLMIFIAAALFGCGICSIFTESAVIIENWSGADVRFEQATIDDQVVWKGPNTVTTAKNDGKERYLDSSSGSVMLHFRAPKGIVELKLVAVNLIGERETLSCALDNRARPCIFSAFYVKGKLNCGKCGDYLD